MTVPTFDGIHRAAYPGTHASPYLDTAAVGIISTDVQAAVQQFAEEHQARGVAAWVAGTDPRKQQALERIAILVNGVPSRTAITQNTSSGLALVVNGIDWREGDNVVVPAGEFPSNFYPWTTLRHRGVELREVPVPRGYAELAEIESRVDRHTRMVALSAVQYSSGYRYDLGSIGRLCTATGALFVVDGTQAVGAMEVDVESANIDVLAVSAHKWMLGPLGVGFVHLSELAFANLRPSAVGWLSVDRPFDFDHEPILAPTARRFESGTENVAGILGISAAVDLVLRTGRREVESHILNAVAYLQGLLVDQGWNVVNDHADRNRSGILIVTSGGDDARAHARLMEHGIRCSLRGGGVRFSPHYFTSSADLDFVADVLAERHQRTRSTVIRSED